MPNVSIGIDIGGTNIRFGIVDRAGNITARKRIKTEAGEGFSRILGRLKKGISSLEEKVSEGGYTLKGIGIGVPGIISSEEGIVRFSPNLPGWVDVPLRDAVAAFSKVSVHVENDANAYALGEATFGAGRGADSMLCITLGTGAGGGIILDKRLWRGENGMAGEVGHMTVEPRGYRCHCGNTGCLERYSSATALVERTVQALVKGKKSILSKMYELDPSSITPEVVANAARNGDRLAISMYGDVGMYLGIASAGIINLLNISRIVIGGGLAGSWDLFIGPLKAEIKARAFNIPASRCDVVPGALGDDAGVLGAASLVKPLL